MPDKMIVIIFFLLFICNHYFLENFKYFRRPSALAPPGLSMAAGQIG